MQLALAAFFAALLAASEVAHEKDRRTLILLLLTRLSNSELVLGKLLASLLGVLVMLAAALPVFMLTALLGGVSYGQIARAMAVTLGHGAGLRQPRLDAGPVARENVPGAGHDRAGAGAVAGRWARSWPPACWARVSAACRAARWPPASALGRPFSRPPALGSTISRRSGRWARRCICFCWWPWPSRCCLNGVAIAMVRVWNPSREAVAAGEERERREERREAAQLKSRQLDRLEPTRQNAVPSSRSPYLLIPHPSPSATRRVWDNPVIWREIRTWAYGRKILVVRLAYLALVRLGRGGAVRDGFRRRARRRTPRTLGCWRRWCLLSLVLVNAQAVTSLTSERDVKALDLLLVTDLTPKEIVYGKLGGVFYNTKEMVLLPMLLCVGLWAAGVLSLENLLFLLGGLAVLYVFAATLGLHAGMTYANSGVAVATSLGTRLLPVPRRGGVHEDHDGVQRLVQREFLPFFAFMVFGGVGLYAVLGRPQPVVGHRRGVVPLPDRHVLRHHQLPDGAALSAGDVPGDGGRLRLHDAAMLVPAICEFDVATGRTTLDE